MWLVSIQRDYYPDVMVFQNKQNALNKYNQECSDINDKFEPEKAVFISEIKDFQKSDTYDLCDENTGDEINQNKMLVRCSEYQSKFCRGGSCEHYYPHEFQAGNINKSWDSKCDNGMCKDNDNKFHAVKCVEWIEWK